MSRRQPLERLLQEFHMNSSAHRDRRQVPSQFESGPPRPGVSREGGEE